MRSPLFILLAAFVLSLLVAQQVNRFSPTHPESAVDRLLAVVRREPALAPALAAADRGEGGPLMEWLNAAPAIDRVSVAGVIIDLGYSNAGLRRDDDSPAADAALYRYRHRLAAFANIPTGKEEADDLLDNLLAYVCVAGTATPSAEDLAIAKRLLPRLEKQMEKHPAHEVWDTIGCIHFVAGEYGKARGAYEEAVRLSEKAQARASGDEKASLDRQVPLYRLRRQAAIDADLRAVEGGGKTGPAPALPLAVAIPPAVSAPAPTSIPIEAPAPTRP